MLFPQPSPGGMSISGWNGDTFDRFGNPIQQAQPPPLQQESVAVQIFGSCEGGADVLKMADPIERMNLRNGVTANVPLATNAADSIKYALRSTALQFEQLERTIEDEKTALKNYNAAVGRKIADMQQAIDIRERAMEVSAECTLIRDAETPSSTYSVVLGLCSIAFTARFNCTPAPLSILMKFFLFFQALVI